MQCFICVTYMFFIATAHPGGDRAATQPEKRSLFHDVIESLRIRSQIPDDNNENNLAQNYNQYGYDSQQDIARDADFIPRRNDRIEMPPLKYRFPKSINDSEIDDVTPEPKKNIVVYIHTTKEPEATTQKPKKPKRTNAPAKKTQKDEEIAETTQKPDDIQRLTNNMAGQSQIGNRESQMVVKPTVIVNIRGSVKHRDGEIRIAARNSNDSETFPYTPQNIFNINQEIKLERTFSGMGSSLNKPAANEPAKSEVVEATEVKVDKSKVEEDMMMCETDSSNPEKNREGRKFHNVLQILFSL